MAAGITPSRQTFRFGDVELDERSGELRKHGSKVRLAEQPFQILRLLLANAGEVVTREELRQALWPDSTFVDFEAGLNSAVRRLRDALNDSADNPRFVETVPRRGYRFIAALESSPPALREPPLPESSVPTPPATAAPVAEPVTVTRSRRPVVVASAVLVVLVLAAGTWAWRRGNPVTPVQIRSVVVLPFENLTGDPEQAYFVDGITDAVTTNLAQLHAVRVISRTSARQYQGARKPLPDIARELDVEGVVEGTVMRSGGRVRVSAQLIHAGTDRHSWSQSYEREMKDVLALQNEVAHAIAQAIHVEIRPAEQRRLAGSRPVHPEAYEAYLRGRYFWNRRGRDDMLKAVSYFEEAIAKDPTYAPAYSGLSDTHRHVDQTGLAPPSESMPKAEAAARKALELDANLAEAHASLAGVLFRYHWDWVAAEKEFRLSLDLDPNSAEAHRAYGVYLTTMRRHEEARAEAQRALELNPLSPVIALQLGRVLLRLGRNEEGLEQLRKAREIDPKLPGTYSAEGMMHLRKGDTARAIAAFEKAASVAPRPPNRWLGYAYAITGRRAEALAMLAELERLSATQYVPPLAFVVIHAGLGDRDRALTVLEAACEPRHIEAPDLSGEVIELFKDEPRFLAVLQRMGLPPPGATGT